MSEPAVEPQRRPLRPPAPVPAPAGLPRPASEVVRAPGAGEPIPVEIRDRVGRSLGVDLRLVRVHADARAHEAAASVGARAFAFGTHIFLGPGERRTDVDLIAHEAAHVVQQQGAPAVQLYAGASDRYEQEASRAQHAVRGGQTFRVAGRTSAAVVQRQDRPGLLQRGWGAITGAVSAGVEAVTDIGWSLLRRFAPELEPIIRQGIFEWLKERIVSAIQSVYDTLTAPIRTVFEFLDFLHSHFRQLVDWMREAAGKIARGDCSSIQEAAQKVHDVLAGIGHAVLDRVKAAAARVGAFFQRLWDRFGAPVWDFLRSVGGAIWERIQSFAAWVWEKTQPIRDAAARAWTWVKNQLGVGEGPEGQNGLLQWVQRKAGEAWDWLKARLEAYKRPLMVVGGILLMLSPAGPIIALGAGIGGLIYGVRWLAQHLRSHDAVVSQRGVLEGTIIPAIQRATNAVVAGISRAAAWLTEKLGAVAGAIGSAAGAIAGSIFSFLASAANWLLDKFRSLLSWATEKVHGLAQWAGDALSRLRTFLEPVIDVLRRFGRVITNLLEIAQLVVTRVWNAIPACIKDPIVNFLVNQILRRIPIFASLLQIPDIWSRIRTFAMTVIQQVFRDGNLAGAAMTVFRFLLDLLRVPVQLVVGIFQKASAALDLIVARPIDFLRNVLLALKDGFLGFVRNIGRHLLSGIVRWLTSTLAEAGVTVPTEWTFGSVFRFVLDVLGITLERVLEILARKVGQPIVDRIRSVIRFLTGAWEFVSVFIREGVGGLWRYVQQRISDLWENVKSAIVGWISQTLIGRLLARLATMLDPSGIGAVVNSIITVYRAIESAIEYVRGILEIVDRWMDMLVGLARGALGAAAERFEDLLDRALPIAIGFLANQVGLRNLGTRIREMIEVVRERVAQAIEWLIDQALRIGRAILERLGLGEKPDDPQKAALKQQALADVRTRARGLRTYEDLRAILAAVLTQYRPQGLLTLSARAEGDSSARIEATASNGVPITVPMRELFNPEELSDSEVQFLLDVFVGVGPPSIRNETYAALLTDGDLRAVVPSAENHAEQTLIGSGDFDHVVDAAFNTSNSQNRRVTVTLVINRAPCTECTAHLLGKMNQIETRRITNPRADVEFVLATTGPYEPMNRSERNAMASQIARELVANGIPKEEAMAIARRDPRMPESRMVEERTRFSGLETLAAAGWRLRQVQQHTDRQTQFNMILAEAIRLIRERARARFEEVERAR